jgi:hypothetical protein
MDILHDIIYADLVESTWGYSIREDAKAQWLGNIHDSHSGIHSSKHNIQYAGAA